MVNLERDTQWQEIRENSFLEDLIFRLPFVRQFFVNNNVLRTLCHPFGYCAEARAWVELTCDSNGYLQVWEM